MPLEDTRADGTDRRGTPGWVARPQDGQPGAAPPVPHPPGAAPPVPHPPGAAPPVPHPPVALAPVPPPGPQVAGSAAAPPRRRSRASGVLAALLVVALLAGGALAAYLWRTTDAWRDSSAQWEDLAREASAQLATTQDELAAAQDELTETKVQLATAQDRITELADEKAQLGDDSAAQQQLADYQARVSQAAGQVATALATCIDGQQQLIGYLDAADEYDAAELERFRQDVDTLCAQAADAHSQLQTELEQ